MPVKRRPRVLVIEDEPALRELSCEFLRMLDYDVEEARNGAVGLALLARGSFDLVLTDLRMPVLDGWGVVEGVRRIAPGLPVVILSGSSEDEDRARACDVPLVLKPVGLSELEAVVRDALALSLTVDAREGTDCRDGQGGEDLVHLVPPKTTLAAASLRSA